VGGKSGYQEIRRQGTRRSWYQEIAEAQAEHIRGSLLVTRDSKKEQKCIRAEDGRQREYPISNKEYRMSK